MAAEQHFWPADDEIAWADATTQAELVRKGEISPRELVDQAISRCEELNPALNALIDNRYAEARREADAMSLDRPFAGVPIVLKDLGMPGAGDKICLGNKGLASANLRPDTDSAYVARLRAAGFISLARTNVPEFGLAGSSENIPFGATKNPWNGARSAGGSSGGSSAAVASGMVSVGAGGDAGGSLRVPASHCALVSLKPSRGRLSAGPGQGDPLFGHAQSGVLTRTVRDNAAILDILSGNTWGDPVWAPPLARPLLEEVGRDPGSLRIGVLDRPARPQFDEDPRCVEAVAIAAALLASLGHEVEPSHPAALEEDEFTDHHLNLLTPGIVNLVKMVERVTGAPVRDEDLGVITIWWRNRGLAVTGSDVDESFHWLDGYRRRMASWWADGFDVLMTPVITSPPPPLGYFWEGDEGVRRSIEILQFTPQFNGTGQPAMVVPITVADDSLPIGVQLVAAYGREDVLIRLAAQIESARPWSHLGQPQSA